MSTIPAWLRGIFSTYGPRPCVQSEDTTLSFADLDRESAVFARGLLARGVGKGTRVGILFGNGTRWVTWWAAVERIGAVCVPLSTFLRPPELARVIRHADLHLLISQRTFLTRDFAEVTEAAFPDLARAAGQAVLALTDAPYLRTIVFDQSAPRWAHDAGWLVDGGRDERWQHTLERVEREAHPDDDALFIYTSGQSAEPKGALFTHGAIVAKTEYLRDMFGFTDATETDVTLPFFWVGGLVMGLFPTMSAGGVTRCAQKSTWGSYGAITPTGPGSATQPKPSLLPSLGMTETFGMYAWGTVPASPSHPIAAPLDQLQPGFEIRLVDDEGAEVPDGMPGQIVMRGPTMARRLQKIDTTEVFDADGFYRTGDLAVRADGHTWFVGRANDVIKTSGANVSPAEVERELRSLAGIRAAHVVGVPDPHRGEVVAAAIVREPAHDIDRAAVDHALRDRLSPYKVPRIVVFLESEDLVPTTASTKVDRRALRDLVVELSSG